MLPKQCAFDQEAWIDGSFGLLSFYGQLGSKVFYFYLNLKF